MVVTHEVALVLFENCDLMDIAAPSGAFAYATRLAARRGWKETPYQTRYYSLGGGLVRTLGDAVLQTSALSELQSADTLLLAGGPTESALEQTELTDWIRSNSFRFGRIASVCTGALMLAGAGLLKGRRASTHWEDCDILAAMCHEIEVDRDAIFVTDANIWTCAGVSAGIDMALAMIEQDFGRDLAFEVAQLMVVFLKRPGSQAQVSSLLQSQAVKGPLEQLLVWILEHAGEDLSVDQLATQANMSLRNFYRNFERQTGMPPGEWVERCRVDIAARLLEQGDRRFEQIAVQSGFGSYERMRRAFQRRLGVCPSEYRERETPLAAERA
jgi:transcriptional regulator GlxA family with amidase domain